MREVSDWLEPQLLLSTPGKENVVHDSDLERKKKKNCYTCKGVSWGGNSQNRPPVKKG